MSVNTIDETNMKRLENLAEKSNLTVNDYLKDILDEQEMFNDSEYLEFCRRTEEALNDLEKKPNNPMSGEEFLKELESW